MPCEKRRLGPAAGAVKTKRRLLVLLACLVVAGGCFWRSYAARMRTHAELLVAFARKAQDLVTTGRFGAENLPELTYPLERAAAFAADARRRTDEPLASLAAFDALLARYREVVTLVDGARHGVADVAALPAAVAAVEAAAGEVEAALAGEGARAAGPGLTAVARAGRGARAPAAPAA